MAQDSPKIIIYDTVDGAPADGAATAAPAQPAARTRSRRADNTAAEKEGYRYDPYIWGIYASLIAFSIIELFSASSSEVSASNVYSPLIRHGIFLLLGIGLVMLIQRIKYVFFRKWSMILAVLSLGLLVYSSYFGIEINGAQRAISILGFTVQPAEIVKITIVLALASILATNQEPRGVSNKGVALAAGAVIVFAGITWKNGLTNTVLLMGVSGAMFLIGGIQWRKLLVVLGIYAICGAALYALRYDNDDDGETDRIEMQLKAVQQGKDPDAEIARSDRSDTHKGRFRRFREGVHPDDPIDDYNRQVIFANFAQAHGGMIGNGPGNSRESARLPLAFSDYIFSIIVEDTGFIGGVILLCFYLCLLGRAGHIASRCTRAFPALLIMGCAVLIVLQAVAHMAIVVGIVPVSGQPLPFFSKGGTSVLVMSAAIGMMLSVSRYGVTNGNKKKVRAELRELPEELHADNPTFIAKE